MAGEAAALCFTSPPYALQRDYTTGGVGDWDTLMQDIFAALPMAGDGQILVNLGLVHRDGEWQPYWAGWIAWMSTTETAGPMTRSPERRSEKKDTTGC